MSPQTNRSQLSGGSPTRTRTLILFWLPTFLVHPLQTESEVPPPARHGHEDEEVWVILSAGGDDTQIEASRNTTCLSLSLSPLRVFRGSPRSSPRGLHVGERLLSPVTTPLTPCDSRSCGSTRTLSPSVFPFSLSTDGVQSPPLSLFHSSPPYLHSSSPL